VPTIPSTESLPRDGYGLRGLTMELFEVTKDLRDAERVPPLTEEQLEAARNRFIAGIQAERAKPEDARPSAA